MSGGDAGFPAGDVAGGAEFPRVGKEGDEVAVPPVVAVFAEVLGGVWEGGVWGRRA